MIKDMTLDELKHKCYDLIAQTNLELGYNTDAKTMVAYAKTLALDFTKEVRFSRLYFEDIQEAFRLGVRYSDEKQFLNIPTFYRWIRKHKTTIDNAYYKVHTQNAKPEQVMYYRNTPKLLNNTKKLNNGKQ